MDEEHMQLLPVLRQAWEKPFTTRADFARNNTDDIAMAACMGLLTVKHDRYEWGRTWRITSTGLQILENAP